MRRVLAILTVTLCFSGRALADSHAAEGEKVGESKLIEEKGTFGSTRIWCTWVGPMEKKRVRAEDGKTEKDVTASKHGITIEFADKQSNDSRYKLTIKYSYIDGGELKQAEQSKEFTLKKDAKGRFDIILPIVSFEPTVEEIR